MNTAIACEKSYIDDIRNETYSEAGSKAYEAGRIAKTLKGVTSSPKDG